MSDEKKCEEFPRWWFTAFDESTVYIPIEILSNDFGRGCRCGHPAQVETIQVEGRGSGRYSFGVGGSFGLVEVDFSS